MAYTKQQVIAFIRRRGDGERASEAEKSLPDVVELPRDEVLLAQLGVDPDDLTTDAEDTPAGEPGQPDSESSSGEKPEDDESDQED